MDEMMLIGRQKTEYGLLMDADHNLESWENGDQET